MKCLFIVSFCLLILFRANSQTSNDFNLAMLSKDFQIFFNEMGWKLNIPLSGSGLIFTNGPTFYRIQDSVYWSNKDYSLMNKFLVHNEHIQDSMIYMILGVNDSLSDMQIVDVYEYDHLKTALQSNFPNPGFSAEFFGGNRRFCDLFTFYLKSLNDNPNEFNSQFKLFFFYNKGNIEMATHSENSWLKKQLEVYLTKNPIKYIPGIGFGRPIHSRHEYNVSKIGDEIIVEDTDYGETFFFYKDSLELFFIEPNNRQNRLQGKMTFLYDKKWTEDEFLLSADVVRIGQELNNPKLIDVLRKFHNNLVVTPFSTIYTLYIVEL